MAATFVSLDSSNDELLDTNRGDEDLSWVLPSGVDANGRPLASIAFTSKVRQAFSISNIKTIFASWKRAPF